MHAHPVVLIGEGRCERLLARGAHVVERRRASVAVRLVALAKRRLIKQRRLAAEFTPVGDGHAQRLKETSAKEAVRLPLAMHFSVDEIVALATGQCAHELAVHV
eukprot:942943-Pleurochrysis_carterae.AAC.2